MDTLHTYGNLLVLGALAAFFIGAIPTGLIISRTFYGLDIRAVGSGNIGATNVLRSLGRKPGVITLIFDLSKGILSVSLTWLIAPENAQTDCGLFFGTCAIFGHCFSPFLKLRGGKGVATALGVFLVINPAIALTAIVIFSSVLAFSKYVSLASLTAAASIPGLMWAYEQLVARTQFLPANYKTLDYLLAITCVLVIFVRHHENIGRLIHGEESRANTKRAFADPQVPDAK